MTSNYKKKYEKLVYNKRNEASDVPMMTEDQIQEIKDAFELFDSNGSGIVKPKDMVDTFIKLGLHKERTSMYNLIKSLNTNENNLEGVSFEQFLNQCSVYYSDRYSREGVKHIFELFDEEGLGYITRDAMRKMSTSLGIFLTKDEIDEIFEKASTDGKFISYEDFEFFMRKDEYQ